MTAELAMKVYAVVLGLSAVAWGAAGIALACRLPVIPGAPRTPGTWTARHAMAVFALCFAAMAAAATVQRAVFGRGDEGPDMAVYAALLYMLNLPTIALLYAVAGRSGAPGESIGLRRRGALKSLGRGLWIYLMFVPLQLLYVVALAVVWHLLTDGDLPQQRAAEAILKADPWAFAWLSLVAVVIAPVFEEIVFRGFIQKGIENSVGETAAVAVTALLFAAVHGAGAPHVLVVAVVLGLVYRRTRNILTCIGFHSAFNGMSVALAVVMRIFRP